MTLWHRTCADGAEAIRREGVLVPHRHPILAASFVWLMDQPGRSRASLGLTSWTLSCDRMAVLFRVDEHPEAVPWLEWCRDNPVGSAFNKVASGDPRCWWVSPAPVVAVEVVR